MPPLTTAGRDPPPPPHDRFPERWAALPREPWSEESLVWAGNQDTTFDLLVAPVLTRGEALAGEIDAPSGARLELGLGDERVEIRVVDVAAAAPRWLWVRAAP